MRGAARHSGKFLEESQNNHSVAGFIDTNTPSRLFD